MRILKYLRNLFISILCVCCLCTAAFSAESNMPLGDIGEYGNWATTENVSKFDEFVKKDMYAFESKFQTQLKSSNFIPIEVKIGVAFMRSMAAVDTVLQKSLVRFTIIFLFLMYAFWVGIEAYKMIRESTEYKTVLYDIFEKGFIIAAWVLILDYGITETFIKIMGPILDIGTYLSDFILNSVAETYKLDLPDTCAAIKGYVVNNAQKSEIIEQSASIMCLPARASVYFYNALGMSLRWIIDGLGHSATAVAVGIVSIFIFIKCIFKYAFMTLGVVADLFLTLMMLPFTALAESLPTTKEKNYVGQVFNGFLGLFDTKKLSEVITKFINATIYFVSLSIVIAICAILLSTIIRPGENNQIYNTTSAMTTLLCGCLVLYLADKTEDMVKKLGGSIDNSFGEQLGQDAKTLWGDTKNLAKSLFKEWLKK